MARVKVKIPTYEEKVLEVLREHHISTMGCCSYGDQWECSCGKADKDWSDSRAHVASEIANIPPDSYKS